MGVVGGNKVEVRLYDLPALNELIMRGLPNICGLLEIKGEHILAQKFAIHPFSSYKVCMNFLKLLCALSSRFGSRNYSFNKAFCGTQLKGKESCRMEEKSYGFSDFGKIMGKIRGSFERL